MKNILYSLVITLALTINLNSQSSVAICGWDAFSGDEFTFVLLRDFIGGEIIYFTEDDYHDGTNNFDFAGEGHIAYTVPGGGLLENEVIQITESSANIFTVGCASGTAVLVTGSGNWSLVVDALGGMADEIYAYSASNPAAPWSSVTEIYSFAWSATSAPTADQYPTPYPFSINVIFNVNGPFGVNADFIDGFRANTTIPIFLDGNNWDKTNNSNVILSCTDFTNQMLPIELISFDARLRGSEVLLDWATATELNNERFEIEHSTDGRTFTHVGTVAGRGTSTVTNEYQMKHSTPKLGINYYRLKQIDYDGAFSYSEIEKVNFHYKSTNISVYPNPFNQDVTLQFPLSEYSYTGKIRTIEVYDIYGRLALSKEVSMDEINIALDLSKLNSGAYFLQTLDEQQSLTVIQRIIKL